MLWGACTLTHHSYNCLPLWYVCILDEWHQIVRLALLKTSSKCKLVTSMHHELPIGNWIAKAKATLSMHNNAKCLIHPNTQLVYSCSDIELKLKNSYYKEIKSYKLFGATTKVVLTSADIAFFLFFSFFLFSENQKCNFTMVIKAQGVLKMVY